jgi:hypothetical protein
MKKNAIYMILPILFLFGFGNVSAQIAFAPRVDIVTGPGYYAEPVGVDIADLDGDGDNDIVVLNYGLRNVAIFFNNGNGTFASPVNYTVPIHPRVVLVQDINGDGNPEILVTAQSSPYAVEILYNNGEGVFEERRTLTTESALWDVRAVDLDGDSRFDLVAANTATNKFSVFINNFDTSFIAPAKTYPTGTGPHIIQPADYDGDYDIDLAIVNFTSNNTTLARNIGKGTFESGGTIATGAAPNSLVATDFNGDTHIDMAVANQSSNTISIMLGNGNGSFQNPAIYSAYGGNPFHIIARDIDLDNDFDLVFVNRYSGSLVILPNNGDGTFGAPHVIAVGETPEGVAAADLDGDEDIDIVTANRDEFTISILFNLINIPSGIGEGENIVPREFTLGQNYPNPFNPETRIDFNLERRANIDISVFNILGQEIVELINESRPAGAHSVYWNGTDKSGRAMPSGLYFYRLRSDNQTEIRKMMLLK